MSRISNVMLACCLIGASAAQAAPGQGTDAPEKAAGNPDKVVCKRFTQIGSLVGTYRTCKTKREWERERDNLRTQNYSTPCVSANTGNCDGK
ncbi:MAG TPA: hypothetical protein VF548_04855 [Allosphingosinicella sp.]|jgi:hypothetical protein